MLSRTGFPGHVVRFPSPFVLSLILSHVEGLPFAITPFPSLCLTAVLDYTLGEEAGGCRITGKT